MTGAMTQKINEKPTKLKTR